jgi:hypothetical protein
LVSPFFAASAVACTTDARIANTSPDIRRL